MNDGVRLNFLEDVENSIEFLRDIDIQMRYCAPRDVGPRFQPRRDRRDRRQRRHLELDVDRSPDEVVDNPDVVTAGGQVERRWPATEAVATEYNNPHALLLYGFLA